MPMVKMGTPDPRAAATEPSAVAVELPVSFSPSESKITLRRGAAAAPAMNALVWTAS